MAEDDLSGSESHESDSDWSSEKLETAGKGGRQGMSEYEKQRMKRIEEDRARMEAMGLPKIASSLIGSVQNKKKKKSDRKGKRKMVEEDDEEYKPPEEERGHSSSSDDDDNEKLVGSGSPIGKVKKKTSNPKQKVSIQKLSSNPDFIDDNDDDLMKAIALSLNDCTGFLYVGHSGPSKSSEAHVIDGMHSETKGNANIQEDTGKRKRKKSIASRVQMTEDELVVHFFQFDEAGKGSITMRDLRRVAAAHDFTWTDKEMADMIYCFDNDGDGKSATPSTILMKGTTLGDGLLFLCS
ncbi:uncharacterized protein LOC132299006 isoform X2 [Cornus florida]|uniref:uncharacterized protein LOC132299006 isoform X2 n=1 Tax=Cornus florida TaxID=4283 RepID=UPI0028A22956|nr:uncharacterized protein LOC132299006 isoform X2 [Cornus florida]